MDARWVGRWSKGSPASLSISFLQRTLYSYFTNLRFTILVNDRVHTVQILILEHSQEKFLSSLLLRLFALF